MYATHCTVYECHPIQKGLQVSGCVDSFIFPYIVLSKTHIQ